MTSVIKINTFPYQTLGKGQFIRNSNLSFRLYHTDVDTNTHTHCYQIYVKLNSIIKFETSSLNLLTLNKHCLTQCFSTFLTHGILGQLYHYLVAPLDANIALKINKSDNWHYLKAPLSAAEPRLRTTDLTERKKNNLF